MGVCKVIERKNSITKPASIHAIVVGSKLRKKKVPITFDDVKTSFVEEMNYNRIRESP